MRRIFNPADIARIRCLAATTTKGENRCIAYHGSSQRRTFAVSRQQAVHEEISEVMGKRKTPTATVTASPPSPAAATTTNKTTPTKSSGQFERRERFYWSLLLTFSTLVMVGQNAKIGQKNKKLKQQIAEYETANEELLTQLQAIWSPETIRILAERCCEEVKETGIDIRNIRSVDDFEIQDSFGKENLTQNPSNNGSSSKKTTQYFSQWFRVPWSKEESKQTKEQQEESLKSRYVAVIKQELLNMVQTSDKERASDDDSNKTKKASVADQLAVSILDVSGTKQSSSESDNLITAQSSEPTEPTSSSSESIPKGFTM